jgi:outer membrane protease
MNFTTKTLLIFLCCFSSAFADNSNSRPDFSIGVSIDQVNGIAYENVYNGNKKISELIWEIQDVHMATLHFEAPIYEKLKLRASYGTALDKGDPKATMVDSDWIGGAGYDDGNTNYNNWTHRSWSR